MHDSTRNEAKRAVAIRIPVLLVGLILAAGCGGKNKYAETDADTDSDAESDVQMDVDTDGDQDVVDDGEEDVPEDVVTDGEEDAIEDVVTDGEEDVVEDTVEDVPADSPPDTSGDVVTDTTVDTVVDTVTDAGCTSDDECDDGDDCTADTCDTTTGTCEHAIDEGAGCDDLDVCTEEDTCDHMGVCGGDPVSCGSTYPCPTADAGDDVVVDAEDAFELDGTGTTNPGGGPLTWDWEGSTDAPPLTDADTSTPQGVATVCGVFTYTLTVTEQCGFTSTDTVQVQVNANGPHVSNTTCDVAMQCGTIAYPWCTIQNGIDGSATSPVMVAGVAGNPYVESPVMADGMDVLGGYEPTFTSLRNTDPTTNDTRIDLIGPAVSWTAGVAATLDGFTVRIVDSSSGVSPDRVHVQADGTATVTLLNDRLDHTLSTVVMGSSFGVQMGAGSGGALSIADTSLTIPDANSAATGVAATPSFDGPVTLTDTSIEVGAAVTTHAVRHLGPGVLTVTGGSLHGGDGDNNSRGIQASDVSAEVHVTDVAIVGGTAMQSYGMDLDSVSIATITGGTILGGGENTASEAVGVDSNNVGDLTIRGAEVVGARPESGLVTTGIGVRISGGGDTVPGPALVDASTVSGGVDCTTRTGISSTGVPLTVQSSVVAGSLAAGGTDTRGILLAGSTPGIEVVIDDNVSITGGAPGTGSMGTPYQAYGIESIGAIPVRITINQLIQGCHPACTGPGSSESNPGRGAGAKISAGVGHILSGNLSILGGPHEGVSTHTAHAGVMGGFNSGVTTAMTELEISDNTRIQGNSDPALEPESAHGVLARDVEMRVLRNELIRGGHGSLVATGIALVRRTMGINTADVTDNLVQGGGASFSTGLAVETTDLYAVRNVIDACGLPGSGAGTPPAECVAARQSWGVQGADNPLVHLHNNYVFGGFGVFATGCQVEIPAMSGMATETVLVYNLCLAQGQPAGPGGISQAVGLRIFDFAGAPTSHVYTNNIIGAGDVARQRYGVQEDSLVAAITFRANDFIPDHTADPDVTYYMHAALGELDTAAAVNALGVSASLDYAANVATDPAFAAPDPYAPTAAGYHMDGTCVLASLGEITAHEDEDYDGEIRSDGSSTLMPEIGPDECSF